MDAKQYNIAGWLAITAAALAPPNVILSLLADTALRRSPLRFPVMLIGLLIGLVGMALAIYVLTRFRALLNERLRYHGVDTLITVIIVLVLAITGVATVGKLVISPDTPPLAALPFLALMLLLTVPSGILGAIVGFRLLQLEENAYGLLRPYAILSIIEGFLFATFILAPVAMVFLAAEHVVLGMMFLRAAEGEPQTEYV